MSWEASRDGEDSEPGHPTGTGADSVSGSEQALAALLLLREVRDQLAEWEPGLIEEAREAGASWADLAHPLGVSSRQAAERRYLRVRPGTPGSTGEQRVRATRDRRAAARTVTTWARANAADLRQLAGQITALTDLPAAARTPVAELTAALADNDTAALVDPLTGTHTYLASNYPDLAARVDDLARHTERLRDPNGNQRQNRT
ncbi:type III effector protein [Streptomyces sp. NPDC020898]|uniref:type III effector protein n=1 Tax=Streptomyces sp. NPDC020898 TaxID=3365101 RepID=UPI003788DE0C